MKVIKVQSPPQYQPTQEYLNNVAESMGYKQEWHRLTNETATQVYMTALIRLIGEAEPKDSKFIIQFPPDAGAVRFKCYKDLDGKVVIDVDSLRQLADDSVTDDEFNTLISTIDQQSIRIPVGDHFVHPLAETKEVETDKGKEDVVNLWGVASMWVDCILNPELTKDNSMTSKTNVINLIAGYNPFVDITGLIEKIEARYLHACYELANVVVQALEVQFQKAFDKE